MIKILIISYIIGFLGMLIFDIMDYIFKNKYLTKNDKIFMIVATIIPIFNLIVFIIGLDFMIMYFIKKKGRK